MHIITGLLITALLGKKAQKQVKSPLMHLKWPIETKHLLPGRVRFSIPLLVGNDDSVERIEQQLQRVDGIDSVSANKISGSVIIRYQPQKIAPELLFAALIRVLGLEKELERTPQPVIAKGVQHVGNALNHAVYSSTHGILDLWTALPLVLLTLGVRKMVTERTLSFPTGFTLLWWAYNAMFRSSNAKN